LQTQEIISYNPATKESIGSVRQEPLESLDYVIKRAQNAKEDWAGLRLTQRARILRMVRKNLINHMDELSELVAAETGKTHWEGFLEVFTTCEHMRHVTRHGPEYLRTEIRSSGIFQNKKCYVNYIPHGDHQSVELPTDLNSGSCGGSANGWKCCSIKTIRTHTFNRTKDGGNLS
jgi:acyl-CoA reductase-like NAD-dependent aldehyde dehydrogenase